MDRDDLSRRVVITGVGPITSIGIGREEVWSNVCKQKQGIYIKKFYLDDEIVDESFFYEVQNFDIDAFGINKEKLKEIEVWKKGEQVLDLNFFLAAIQLAIDDSGINLTKKKSKTGVILAHEQPGVDQFLINFINKSYEYKCKNSNVSKKEYFNKLYNEFSRSVYDQQSFMYLYHVAKTFDLHGYSLFINNSCSSGLYALEAASQLIKNGTLDTVIISAVDVPDLFRCLWMKENNLYSIDGKIRPFDENRNGFVCGQGGAALILESCKSARNRDARIYAEYVGGEFVLESWKVTLPNISENYYSNLIKNTIIKANLKLSDVDLINSHGVATNIVDQYEVNAINNVFCEKESNILVNAIKPYIGHTLSANALLETAILLISMKENVVIPTLNVKNRDSKLKINLVTELLNKELNTVLKLSCGFGGFDGAALFKKL